MPTLPSLQLQIEESGQVTTPCIKLSGVLGLNNDVAVMTDCQCGRAMYMVMYQSHHDDIVNKLDSLPIIRCDNLNSLLYH